jgi:penicillin-binding protein 1A
MLEETLATGTGRSARGSRLARRRQDRHQPGFPRRLVRRLHRSLVAGVWLGNDDNSPTKRASGSNVPVDIWNRFMRAALENMPVVGLPGAVEQPYYAPTPPRPIEDGPIPGGSIPPAVRDEAPLDNWLLDRLFGRR